MHRGRGSWSCHLDQIGRHQGRCRTKGAIGVHELKLVEIRQRETRGVGGDDEPDVDVRLDVELVPKREIEFEAQRKR